MAALEKVSVIIPAYNCAAYIARTVKSVMAQTWTNWEMIIVNDGSTDNTIAVLEEFLQNSRIQLIHQQNSGVSVARNTGIENATGEYIAFLDADDLWTPEYLEKKLSALNEATGDYAFSDLELINEHDEHLGYESREAAQYKSQVLEWKAVLGPPSNLVIRRKALYKMDHLFDPAFSTAADQDFGFRLISTLRGTYLSEPLLRYRVLPGSMSRNIELMEKDHRAVFQKAYRLNLFDSHSQRRRAFANLYLILAGSWWVNGQNKIRGIRYLLKSVFTSPAVFIQRYSNRAAR